MMIDSAWLRRFRRQVRGWYAKHGRDLLWRRSCDPYPIWISEIMLQQTTVAAVGPYYERFLNRFPTVHQLAAAPVEDVLRLWEGLGYYSRARNIHKTATKVAEEFGGRFPNSAEELQQLPGIGRYTANAIASFAYDQSEPIVEANTLRLYCRLLGYEGDPRSRSGQKKLWDFAEQIVPRQKPGAFNHALMDLGATVCTVKEPRCEECPARSCCAAFSNNSQHSIPRPKPRAEITSITEVAVAIEDRGRYLLRQYTESERWTGLWDFVRFPITIGPSESVVADATVPSALLREATRQVQVRTGIDCEIEHAILELHHSVTRYRIRLICLKATRTTGQSRHANKNLDDATTKWVRPSEFDSLPFSVTGRKLARHFQK